MDVRDEVVDYIHYWHERSDLDLKFFLEELDLKANKFNSWRKRYIVHWEIRESMTERDAAIILQKAQENYSSFQPRIISDNGPQFIARDFKELVRIKGMTHVRTSPYYPQSNGKLERFNGTFKQECIRPKVPLSKEEAEREAKKFVDYYNNERLHSAIGYISPKTKLEGKEREIFELREERLAAARLERQIKNKIRQVA